MFILSSDKAASCADALECVSWDCMIFHLVSVKPLKHDMKYLLERLHLAEVRMRMAICRDFCVYFPWQVAKFLFGPSLPLIIRRRRNIYSTRIEKKTTKMIKKVSFPR